MTIQQTLNVITIKELASELYINSKSLRKKLRDNGIPKPGTRWEWNEDHESVITIRSWKDQPAKVKKSTKEGKAQEALAKLKEIHEEPVEPQGPQVVFQKVTPKGEWQIFKGEEGVKALYQTEKGLDSTKWITEESNIRPTLPKYIQEEIKKAL